VELTLDSLVASGEQPVVLGEVGTGGGARNSRGPGLMFRLAVLASGSGTNLQAIIDKLHRGGAAAPRGAEATLGHWRRPAPGRARSRLRLPR